MKKLSKITVNWTNPAPGLEVKGFNVAVTKQGETPSNSSFCYGRAAHNVNSYVFNNVLVDVTPLDEVPYVPVTYVGWVQAVYTGGDSSWKSTTGVIIADDGISSLATVSDITSAQVVSITGGQVFKYSSGSTSPTPSQIVLTATLSSGLSGYDWEYFNGTSWVNLSGTQNAQTYTLDYANAAFSSGNPLRIRCVSGGVFDETTVVKIYDGEAITPILTNSTHSIPADSSGNNPVLTGSGTDIKVWLGTNALTYGTGNSQFSVSASGTAGLTLDGANTPDLYTRRFPDLLGMSVDTGTVTYTITVKNAFGVSTVLTLKQTLTKVRAGVAGGPGANGWRTAILELYKWSASAPTGFPSGNSTYTWATGSFGLPTTPNGWSLLPPAAVAGQTLWGCCQTISNQETDAQNTVSWTTTTAYPIGASGSDGQAVNMVFQRSSGPSTPTASSGTPSGWYGDVASVPLGNDPIWSSIGTRLSPSLNWTWQTPIKVEGQNNVIIHLFQRANSAPNITTDHVYNFSTKTFTTLPSGWTQTIPSGSSPVYVKSVSISSSNSTFTVTSGMWSSATILAQNGTGYPNITSAASLTISVSSKTFTVSEDEVLNSYSVGDRVRIARTGYTGTHWMEGAITAYSSTSMTVGVDLIKGSGTYSGWSISLGTRGIFSVVNYYAVNNSSSVAPSTWYTTAQTPTSTNPFLWNYEVLTYTDSTTEETPKCVIGNYAANGKGISSITEEYVKTSTTSPTPSSGWSTTIPVLDSVNRFLWNRETINYTDSSSDVTQAKIIGVYGDTGGIGPGGPVIRISTTAQAFTFTDGIADPTSQTITLTANKQNTGETVYWNSTPAVGTFTETGTTNTGDSKTLTLAQFGSNKQVVITATGATSGAKDTVSLVRLERSPTPESWIFTGKTTIDGGKVEADTVSGKQIQATSQIFLDNNGYAVFGLNNICIETTAGNERIIVAPDNGSITKNADGSLTRTAPLNCDYAELKQGDITFYYWNGTSHTSYKTLKRVEIGECSDATEVTLPGIWKTQPTILVSPKLSFCGNNNISDMSFYQRALCTINYNSTTKVCKFTPDLKTILYSPLPNSETATINFYQPYTTMTQGIAFEQRSQMCAVSGQYARYVNIEWSFDRSNFPGYANLDCYLWAYYRTVVGNAWGTWTQVLVKSFNSSSTFGTAAILASPINGTTRIIDNGSTYSEANSAHKYAHEIRFLFGTNYAGADNPSLIVNCYAKPVTTHWTSVTPDITHFASQAVKGTYIAIGE
jgi:hypothetical protein